MKNFSPLALALLVASGVANANGIPPFDHGTFPAESGSGQLTPALFDNAVAAITARWIEQGAKGIGGDLAAPYVKMQNGERGLISVDIRWVAKGGNGTYVGYTDPSGAQVSNGEQGGGVFAEAGITSDGSVASRGTGGANSRFDFSSDSGQRGSQIPVALAGDVSEGTSTRANRGSGTYVGDEQKALVLLRDGVLEGLFIPSTQAMQKLAILVEAHSDNYLSSLLINTWSASESQQGILIQRSKKFELMMLPN